MYFHLGMLIFIHALHPGFTKGSNTVFGGPKCQHPKRSQLELEYDWFLSMFNASKSVLYINSLYCYRKNKQKKKSQTIQTNHRKIHLWKSPVLNSEYWWLPYKQCLHTHVCECKHINIIFHVMNGLWSKPVPFFLWITKAIFAEANLPLVMPMLQPICRSERNASQDSSPVWWPLFRQMFSDYWCGLCGAKCKF